MRKVFPIFLVIIYFAILPRVFAQELSPGASDQSITTSPTPSPTPTPEVTKAPVKDITKPDQESKNVLMLFTKRPAISLKLTNFMAYAVQYAVRTGVPANTIVLILLLPFLATIIAAVRHIIGLPSIGMLVPIALSITLLATGVVAGLILLTSIILASALARLLLKRVRIMQLPKLALSMLVVVLFIFLTLTFGASTGMLNVGDISIFPVLLLILLTDRIVSLFLERSLNETIEVTLVTIIIGLGGFLILSLDSIRSIVLLYPELVLLLIPINIVIGRYFGLRLTEYTRFAPVLKHGSK